jgi:DNA-binding IclR family transcriptional regulator
VRETTTVQSLLRGLSLLSLVGRSSDGLPLHEAARQAGLKRPATHKILRTLAVAGFVTREANPARYRLGPAVYDLARMQEEGDLLRRAADMLEGLQKDLPAATLTLARSLGGEVMVVLRMSPERIGFLEHRTGGAMSPYSSASTLTFQAFWADECREEYRRRHPFSEYGAHLWKSPAALERFLAATRRAGCVEPALKGESYLVGAPVFDTGGTVRAVLGARVPATDCSAELRRRLRTAVIATARALSAVPRPKTVARRQRAAR